MIKAKKSLGQNFLIDKNILEKIVNTTKIKNKTVLEIGPGTGNLTTHILRKKPKKMIVIEKDFRLINGLNKNFGSKIKVINEDILKINENLISKEKLTVFGNLPYNISTEILCKWVLNINDKDLWFDNLILMFQREVAERITAKPNTPNYGRLSIISNWKLDIKKICDVSPSSFSPKPKVDSSILLFTPKKNFFKINNSKNLEKISRIFFMHRRKMIKKPYYQLFNRNNRIFEKLGIKLNLRPQNLSLETYLKLAKEYEKLRN